ncbi:MAG: universal stress protein [Thermoleophilaceae bacterium]|nr:universal stress protein [Thermoleophilaceae bacterium]
MSGGRSRGPRVVVGYDGSDAARAAVAWAAARAGRTGKVWVVHSLDPVHPAHDGGEGKAVLDALVLEGGNALIDVDYHLELVTGDPAEALDLSAREHDADEIAIGSRGFGKLRATLGSVSHDLLHRADRPVLVIPGNAVSERAGADG